jgi:hypothetical protein
MMKNEHGIVCPIPLEDWPNNANWCTIDGFGGVDFFSTKPYYDPKCNIFMIKDAEDRIDFSDRDYEGDEYHIWSRTELGN